MQREKEFKEWRAEKLGYVFLSRQDNLIIKEESFKDALFDFLIDIGENQKPMGRLFGVEVKAISDNHFNTKLVSERYRNITFPFLLLAFDNHTDKGYFRWIKEPHQDGRLSFDDSSKTLTQIDGNSLQNIVNSVKDWYAQQLITSE